MDRIRKCLDTDLIKELQKECFPYDKIYITDECLWWVCYWNNKPVGFYGWEPMKNKPFNVYICRCGVIPSHRGRRLQKKMASVALLCAKNMGYRRAVSDTRQNPPSANSFISSGFKTFTPEDPWSFKDSIYWYKIL